MISKTMLDNQTIMDVLRTIPDPEMPISIVDLGLVERLDIQENSACVSIDILPTFVGCPALPMIEKDIRTKVQAIEGVKEVVVRFVYDPPWSVDRISDVGRKSLAEHGVTVPETGSKLPVPGHDGTVTLHTSAIACPFCESNNTRLESSFGPTRCRMIYYCDDCRNTFEHMKRV